MEFLYVPNKAGGASVLNLGRLVVVEVELNGIHFPEGGPEVLFELMTEKIYKIQI